MADENKEVEKQEEAAKSTPETQNAAESAAEAAESKVEEVKEETVEKVEEAKTEATDAVEEVQAEVTDESADAAEETETEGAEAVVEKRKMEADDTTTKMVGSGDTATFEFNSPEDSFDWDATDDSVAAYSKEEFSSLENQYTETLSELVEKSVITGRVVDIGKKEIVVNIGSKSEGVVQASEFRYNPDLKPGDEVPIFVEQQEDRNGQLVVSHKTARLHSAWERINDALGTGEVLKGLVKSRTKGGLIVDVFGLEAFLPGSQIDVKPIRDYDVYVGKQMEFKVVKINHEFKNVVVSHKALIEAELEEQKKQIISGLEKGQVLEGQVKNITSYGVFIDLGGIDGLVHITDLSWGRINHPEEIVELDQKLNVVILDFDDDKKRIALGLKQLSPHPWEALDENLNVGDKVKGKVVVLADYGAFVEIAPGVEGLVHVSEMSWSQHLRSAQDFLKVGDEIETVILTLEREERKMSLGIKQLVPDPWADIESKYPVESKHTAKVKNFTNFGVFVELEEGIDGLIHISDLSWSKKIKHPSEFCAVDQELDVIVLELDKDNRRLSLGHKQLEENPWDVFETVFSNGSSHQGTIVRKEGNQFVVALPYGVEGYVTAKQLKKEDGTQANIEETLDFIVVDFNKNAKRIGISHLRTHSQEEDRTERKKGGKPSGGGDRKTSAAVARVNDRVEKATLGDLGVLAGLKAELEGGSDKPAAKKEAPKAAPKKEEPKKEEPKAEEPKKEDVKEDKGADDLKKIEGIGPKIASTLTEAGIGTFAALSESTPEKISEIISEVRGNHVTDTWPEQAKMAAEGKWDELKKWQDELDGGKA